VGSRAVSTLWGREKSHYSCKRHDRRNLPTKIGRTTTNWAHRRGYTEIEVTDGSAAISTAILEAPEDEQYRSKHIVHQ
jgi:hypothetical protein